MISLARYSLTVAQGWASEKPEPGSRRNAESERLEQEAMLLREKLRITGAWMAHLLPQRRPHYPPCERMPILELRSAAAAPEPMLKD